MSHVISAFEGGAWEPESRLSWPAGMRWQMPTESPSLPPCQVPGPPWGSGSAMLTAKGEAAFPGQPSDARWRTHLCHEPCNLRQIRDSKRGCRWTVSLLRANYAAENPPRRVAKLVCRLFSGEVLKRQCHIWTENFILCNIIHGKKSEKTSNCDRISGTSFLPILKDRI